MPKFAGVDWPAPCDTHCMASQTQTQVGTMQRLTITEEIYAKQIQLMQIERQNYVARVAELMRFPDRQQEVDGYLGLINQINNACISLANDARNEPCRGTVDVALAALLEDALLGVVDHAVGLEVAEDLRGLPFVSHGLVLNRINRKRKSQKHSNLC